MNSSSIELLNRELNSDNPGAEELRIGKQLIASGKFLSAKKVIKKAHQIHKLNLHSTHPVIGEDLTMLGIIEWNLDNISFAHKYFFEALDIDKQNFKHHHHRVIRNINNLGLINKAKGRINEAIWLFDRALITSLQDNPDISTFLVNSSLTLLLDDQYTDAKKQMERALKIDTANEIELNIARDLMFLGLIQKYHEKPEKIIGLLEKALEIFEKNNEYNLAAYCLTYLGDSIDNNMDKKIFYYKKALEIFKLLFPDNHANVIVLKRRINGYNNKP